MDLDARQAAAVEIAEEAGALAHDYFGRRGELKVEQKGLQDLVSQADREVEALIRRRLTERFPEDAVLGEEAGGARDDRALWIIDPIDGTTNFLRGLPHWSVVLGFMAAGKAELCVMKAPVLAELYVARHGHGAFCNSARISVSQVAKLEEAVVAFGSNKKTPHGPYLKALESLLDRGAEYRRLASASMSLAAVASGKLEGYHEAKLAPWDAVAGMLLVREAGGRTNDYFANDGLKKGNTVMVANQALYETLAAAFECA